MTKNRKLFHSKKKNILEKKLFIIIITSKISQSNYKIDLIENYKIFKED